jgi:4a-hydroxytetrahydrobiopterin dehydratase
MALLPDDAVESRLRTLAGWQRDGVAIRKVYRFSAYKDVLGFVAKVGALAEAQDHHPDMLVQYGQVTVTLTSHDAGGLTARDFRLAESIDA